MITTFLHYRPFVFDISIDGGEPRKGEYTLIAVANGRCYGGGIIPAPDADLFSGKFEVCIADKIVKHQVIRFFPKYAKGKHAGLDIVNIKSCKKITVSSKETIYLNADGEIFETEKAEFEILDIKLPVSVLR